MESLVVVVIFTLALVAIVELGRGVRGKFGSIEIATQDDSISRSKKNHGSCHITIASLPYIDVEEKYL